MEIVNHEYYVSLEVAKLLKEAGFDLECKTYYNISRCSTKMVERKMGFDNHSRI